jgi:hypothetical protein
MRRGICTVIAGLLVLATGVSAQKQGQLFVSINSPDGKRVEGLAPADVTVTEDGMACKTTKVEPVDWPTKVQILVDNGRSNTNPITPLREGLKGFIDQMPDGTEMSMYVIAGSPRPIVKPTTDKQKMLAGIAIIAPDNGAGQFFDSLVEAADRVDKDKTPGYPIIVIIGSDFGSNRMLDSDFAKLQNNIFNHGIKTHVLISIGGQGAQNGGSQIDLGLNMTKLSGGRYENYNTPTRLATLLPEIGKDVVQAIAIQSHQYRVTYEPCAKPSKNGVSIGLEVRKEGAIKMSLRGTY